MNAYWFGVIALAVVLLFAGFGYADETRLHWVAESTPATQPLPDRVVGVERKCEKVDSADGALSAPHLVAAEACALLWDDIPAFHKATPPNLNITRYTEIIVRTQAGTIYRVQLPAEDAVALNDEWPPK